MARAQTEEQKEKIKAAQAAKRALRAVPLLELPPYKLIRADDSNISVVRMVKGEKGRTTEETEGWWPLSIRGFEAAIGWCLGQKATSRVERAKTTQIYLSEILEEVRRIAEALANEAER